MASKFIILVSLLPLVCPLNYAKWMTENKDLLGPTKLVDLVMVEAHDAGTYDLKTNRSEYNNDVFAPDDDNLFIDLGALLVPDIVKGWSQTQTQTIYEQLNSGVRVLDIRVCADQQGTLYTCHGLYGATISEVFADVKKFATENPLEFVIVGLNSFHGWNSINPGPLSAEKHAALQAMITSDLGSVLVNHQLIDKPTLSLKAMWELQAQGSGFGSVIIVYDNNEHHPGGYWKSDTRQSTWANTWDYTEKKKSLQTKVPAVPANKMVSFSAQATPDSALIILGFNPLALAQFYPQSLRNLHDNTSSVVLGWILFDDVNISSSRIGVIGIDFVNTTCAVDLALYLNKIPDASLSHCSFGQKTHWEDWHAKHKCPDGFSDDLSLLYCQKPQPAYTRKGYPWKFGDKPFDYTPAMARCEAENGGPGSCEFFGAIAYPKCKTDFHSVACCVCSYDCPTGYPDVGEFCQK
jgi:hypothetical protein